MRENESDAAAHIASGVSFRGNKEDFDQKRWYSCEKRAGRICVRLVPSRFVSKTRCFLSFQKQHDYPRGVKVGLRQLPKRLYYIIGYFGWPTVKVYGKRNDFPGRG
jgi:hypothetical protein